jgi:hypothetical protein
VYAAAAFDKDVCDKFTEGLDAGVKGTWAEGRLVSEPCRADEALRSLIRKTGGDPGGALYGASYGGASGPTGAGGTDGADAPASAGGVTGGPDAPSSAGGVTGGADAPASTAGATGGPDASPSMGGVGQADGNGPEEMLFEEEILMLDKLIAGQEDALRAVYNSQEEALAKLIDSMNELLDTYADEGDVEEMGA